MNKIVDIYREKNRLVVDLDAMPGWDAFDEMIDFLVEEHNALVVQKMDGIFDRISTLKVNGHEFQFNYDEDFGTSLIARTKESEEIILKIAKEVETRLRGKIVSLGDGIEGRVSGDEAAFVTFWNSKRDVTDAIYEKLKNKPYFESLILGGCSYGLMEAPLEHLDELLDDVKRMDKSDLKKELQ